MGTLIRLFSEKSFWKKTCENMSIQHESDYLEKERKIIELEKKNYRSDEEQRELNE